MTEGSPVSPPAATREERKVVTALFADLVGSTALGERLDPEEVRLVVGEAVARVVTEVERLGGHVKDLAGDGVLAFFGAPVGSEDDPERAVRAGLAIIGELSTYGREVAAAWGIEGFGVRVAAATGPVVLGTIGAGSRVEYAAYGDTVNTAARLQAAAEPGSMLVDAATQRLVAHLFEWDGPRLLQLKGKDAAVDAWTVAGLRPIARKQRGLAGVQAPVLGREAELVILRATVDRLRAGSGGILVVSGEAGIGKSRLLLELRAGLEQDDGPLPLWLEGRCVSYGESLPLWPFRDLLRSWLDVGVDEPALRVRVSLRRAVEALFGERALELYPYLASVLELTPEADAALRLAELSPEALQYRTFEVIGELFERLAAEAPVVIALEDLHWADPTSVQLVERLLLVVERAAVLLAVTQRSERDHLSWQLKERASREFPHLLRELVLEPLSGDAQRELLHALVGRDVLPETLEAGLLEVGEGNPFFLEELVRSFADAGALVREGEGWRFEHAVSIEIPPTVEKVILARIDRLASDCHAVLAAASALGRRFGLPLLEGVVTDVVGDGALADALHELQRLDLISVERRWPEPEYRFKHVLIQEAAYRTLLSARRQALHRRAAEWLEREHAESLEEVLGLLAHHWLAADDHDKAIAYLARAGDQARLAYALDESIEHYQALLPLLERRGQRQEMALVLFKLALALHRALRFREANETYQQAFALWQAPRVERQATETLRVAMTFAPSRADPLDAYNPNDIQLQMALNDRLVERWPEATIVPSLAERWEISDDGLRYLFHLRDGLRWSDGVPLTADDVEYGVKRILDPERPGLPVVIYYVLENAQDYALGRLASADTVGVRALDERTVEFRLVAPAPYFLDVANRPDCGPQPRHAIERYEDAWTEPGQHVACGAFRLVERTPERVVIERRESDGRTGNVGRVELLAATENELVELYRGDRIDILAPRVAQDIGELYESHPDEVRLAPAGWLVWLMLDHRQPALASTEFRLALAHAIDRDALAEVMAANFIVATGGAVPPMLQGHTPDIAPRFEPERARELLARSGVGATELKIACQAGSTFEPLARRIAKTWTDELNLPADVRPVPVEQWVAAEPQELGPIVTLLWFPGYADPEYYLRFLLHSESKDNVGRFSYRPYDELLERARHEPDARTRLELFHQADRMAVAEQAALIPIAYARNVAVVKPWVSGWWEFGKSWPSFADLVVGERPARNPSTQASWPGSMYIN